MLKFIALSKCGLCTQTAVQAQPVARSVLRKTHSPVTDRFKEIRAAIKDTEYGKMTKSKQVLVKASPENVKAITTLLEKYNVDVSQLKNDKKIFNETQSTVERRILVLKEMGVPSITTSHIVNFISSMYLTVPMYKAYFCIDPDVNLAERLLSIVNNSKVDCTAMNHLDQKQYTMKVYYYECIIYYLKCQLDLTDKQTNRISYKKYTPVLYNSFKFLEHVLRLVKEEFNLSTRSILQNYYWLISHHPDNSKAILSLLKSMYEDVDQKYLVLRYPKILNCDIKDLELMLSSMKSYGITAEMIHSAPQVFHIKSAEFKARMENILSNPFTLVYQKHPRFLHLIRDYPIMLPRLKYLQEKNFKFATIHSLTTFHNYLEQLTTTRKLNRQNLISFFKLQFGDDAEKLYARIQKHPFFQCVPLVQMYESLMYLKENYPMTTIYNCIYAILYSKSDLEAAHKEVMKDSRSKQLTPQQVLSFCLYKIEASCHFTGDGVLMPDKYGESLNENVNHEERIEDELVHDSHQSESKAQEIEVK